MQAHAASAVVNFCEGLDETTGSNIVGRYIKPLSEHLVVLLQTSNQLVVEGALTATSSIADSAGVRPRPALLPPMLTALVFAGAVLLQSAISIACSNGLKLFDKLQKPKSY